MGLEMCRVARGEPCPHDPPLPQDSGLAGTFHRRPQHPPYPTEETDDPASPRDSTDGHHLPRGEHRGAPAAPQQPLREQLPPSLGRERGQRGGAGP